MSAGVRQDGLVHIEFEFEFRVDIPAQAPDLYDYFHLDDPSFTVYFFPDGDGSWRTQVHARETSFDWHTTDY